MTSPQQPNPYSKDSQGPSPYSSEPQHSSPYSQQYPAPPQPQYPTPTPANFQSEPPLWAPYYGISFRQAIGRFFKKYADFTGRAGRGEYWWWILASVIISVILQTITSAGISYDAYGNQVNSPVAVFGGVLLIVYVLGTIVPSLALAVRRLHDANFSGLLVLLLLVPFVGAIAVFVMTLMPSNPAGQRFDRPTAPAYRA